MNEFRPRPESILHHEYARDNLAVYIAQAQPSVRKGYFVRYENGRKIVSDLEKEQEVFLARAVDILKVTDCTDDTFQEVFNNATREVYSHLPEEELPLQLPELFRESPELLERSHTAQYYWALD